MQFYLNLPCLPLQGLNDFIRPVGNWLWLTDAFCPLDWLFLDFQCPKDQVLLVGLVVEQVVEEDFILLQFVKGLDQLVEIACWWSGGLEE